MYPETVDHNGSRPFALEPADAGGREFETRLSEIGTRTSALDARTLRPVDLASGSDAPRLAGTSRAMRDVLASIYQAGPSRACVLISGESGTGKDVAARLLHSLSRQPGPYIAINCAALPETLIESELFGHERGAFTGAIESRRGCFEMAQDGTLLLDEIAEMPAYAQAKLLRAIEDGRVRRVGGRGEVKVDVRVIAATNRNPGKALEDGRLREDLYYRLSVFQIYLPPLRDRKEDIASLTTALLSDLNRKHQCSVSGVSRAVLDAFKEHNWPGNVRELKNVLERATILVRQGVIDEQYLPTNFRGTGFRREDGTPAGSTKSGRTKPDTGLSRTAMMAGCAGATLADVEKAFILEILEGNPNNKKRAAAILGISIRTLHNRLRKYGLGR